MQRFRLSLSRVFGLPATLGGQWDSVYLLFSSFSFLFTPIALALLGVRVGGKQGCLPGRPTLLRRVSCLEGETVGLSLLEGISR